MTTITFESMTDTAGFKAACATLVASEATIRDTLNQWGVAAISGIMAGDNISQINSLVASFSGVRQTRLLAVLKGFVPFKLEDGVFTVKVKAEKELARKVQAYADFLNSEATLYSLLNDKKEAEKKPVNYAAKLQKAAEAAMSDGGMSAEQVMAIINAVVAAEAAQELLEVKEAA